MCSAISIPDALSSEAGPWSGAFWRLVEAQHRIATMKLVDSVAEHQALEDLIDAAKPPLPPECRHLHYLLSTPFRYGAPYPKGSRFRRAGMTPGVFYASLAPRTAVAEMAFHRLLFFAESPATPWPANPAEVTAFAAEAATRRAIDLTAGLFASGAATWRHPTDLGPCQDLAEAARAASVEVIRYASVRDPAGGVNLALLTCRAFTTKRPTRWQTWRVRLSASGVQAKCEAPAQGITFDRGTFAADPRIVGLDWDRRTASR